MLGVFTEPHKQLQTQVLADICGYEQSLAWTAVKEERNSHAPSLSMVIIVTVSIVYT